EPDPPNSSPPAVAMATPSGNSGAALPAAHEEVHYSNFDFIRVVAAASVIFSHSFLIAEGTEKDEPFERLFGGHNILGIYGVFIFFIISGFLVTQSAYRSGSLSRFVWKRFLRGAVAGVVGKGRWRNLRLDETSRFGVGAPMEITPWKAI